ncbi:MAG: ATP-binding protein [Bacteroidales bacterium]|jgi:predicted AAA+ superfamily ATPase|nr:ATP-binding protein [Bacteroidales bacterium]
METQYLKRNIDSELLEWSNEPNRKVLLLRGARQVGKSSAVRNLAKSFKYFVEVNFEKRKKIHSIFEEDFSPQEICKRLEVEYGTPIVPGETLLFLDEIQGCLQAISKLRYFYEEYPQLHVVAAGSLLEFALEEIPSFGVGRIRSLYMFPFSFDEFLVALGEYRLVNLYRQASPQKPMEDIFHNKLNTYLKTFFVIGGMPEVVAEYCKTGNFLKCQKVLNDILVSLRGDFAKYKKRVSALRIDEVFQSVIHQSKGKFVFERAAVQASNAQVKQALDLLMMAGLVYSITRTAANGIPLGAEINLKFQRYILLDTGLFQRALKLNVSQILISDDLKIINNGAIAEIFVGLELIKAASCYDPVTLYYWEREKRQANAQVDFLIQRNEQIVPIEVKSGTQGAMQSLRVFMSEKKITKGIRTSLENFAQYENIEVYPIYAISNLFIDVS